ncbi:MAG: glycosyltransferase [Candidatus Gastranaerophilales bacterium]|nr:glycosyltransferase [Candidatus Gastranaerophilales bacterium]
MAGFKLLLTTNSNGKLAEYTKTLGRELIKNFNAQICFAIIGNGDENFKEFENEQNKILLLNNFDYAPENFYKFNQECHKITEMISYAAEDFSPHLIHLNHYLGSTEFDAATILTAHSTNLKQKYFCEKEKAQYNDFMAKSTLFANEIVTTSKINAKKLSDFTNVNKKINIIYNGISSFSSEKSLSLPSIIIEANFPNSDIFLSKICSKLPENIYIFILSKNSNSTISSDKIQYISDKDVFNFNRENSIYLALSSSEHFGLNSMRAAAINCAIISNDTGFYRELWNDCGVFYRKNDLNSLLRQINNLMENKPLLSKIAQKCKMKSLTSFTAKRMAFDYVNVYKKALIG